MEYKLYHSQIDFVTLLDLKEMRGKHQGELRIKALD